jgi:hypothetical protein
LERDGWEGGWGMVLDISEKFFEVGQIAWCCLYIPEIPAFALFQCFPTFQQLRKKIILGCLNLVRPG